LPISPSVVESSERPMAVVGEKLSRKSRLGIGSPDDEEILW
jgi:hypothetical protein